MTFQVVRLARVLAAGLATIGLLCSCSASAVVVPRARSAPLPTSSSPPPPPAQGPSVDPEQVTRAEILRVYAEFLDARRVSLKDPQQPPDRRIYKVSAPPARDELYSHVVRYRRLALRMRGGLISHPGPARLVDERTAVLRDCVDRSNEIPVLHRTGRSRLAPGQADRVPVDVTLTRLPGWVVTNWNVKRGEPCA